jgi:hypothetical protein
VSLSFGGIVDEIGRGHILAVGGGRKCRRAQIVDKISVVKKEKCRREEF